MGMRIALLLLALAPASAFAQGPLSELAAAAGHAPAAVPAAKGTPVAEPAPAASTYRSVVIEGVTVRGYPPFVEATRAALTLLKDARSFHAIRAAVPRIEEHACSGMNVYASTPTFYVGAATWRAGPLWYAGAIAHDARHAQLYAAARARLGGLEPRSEQWKDVAGERLALDYQAGVLRELRAPAPVLEFLKVQRDDPRYQNVGRDSLETAASGAPPRRPRSGLDCRGRTW